MNFRFKKNKNGFVALIIVLIILAIGISTGVGLGLRSISGMKMSLQKNQSSRAYYLTNLCAEHALMKLKEDSNYTGNEIIIIESENCTVMPIEGNWTVKVSGDFKDQIKKMKIIVSQIDPEMVIDSWEEVPNF